MPNIKLEYTESSIIIAGQQYQKGAIAQISYGNIITLKMRDVGKEYSAPLSDWRDKDNFNFVSIAALKNYLTEHFFFDGGKVEFIANERLNIASPAPAEPGLYALLEPGTYSNLGGIVAESGKLNMASFDGATWAIISIDVPLVVNGLVADGNTAAVSGGEVFKALPKISLIKSEFQLFDKTNFISDQAFSSANNNQNLIGAGTTKYINIPEGQTVLSFSGLGTSAARRLAWATEIDGGGTFTVATISVSSASLVIPSTAKSFRFFFKRPEDGAVEETFMLNFGSAEAYQQYYYIREINGMTFGATSKEVKRAFAVMDGTSPTLSESGWYRCCPVVADVVMKGNTGLGFDIKRNLFIVSEYNTTISSRLLLFRHEDLVDRNTSTNQISTPYKVFDLSEHIDHIQGCCWDFVDDTYLALGTKKGGTTSSTDSVVVKVSPFGNLLDIIPLGDNMTVQVGMIDVLSDGNYIIKPNIGSSAYIFNRALTLIDRKSLIGNEGIAVNKFTGEIWAGSDLNTIKKYDSKFNELATYNYNTFSNEQGNSNVEGMCILRDGSLCVSADAFLHGGTQLGNSLFFFDFEETVNKQLNFYLPNGIGNFKDLKEPYMSEIITPTNNILSIEVVASGITKKTYRSAPGKAPLGLLPFTNTLSNDVVFQLKIE